MRPDLDGRPSEILTVQRAEKIMTEMQHDERLARGVQAAEDRKRPRANPDDERDAVIPRALNARG